MSAVLKETKTSDRASRLEKAEQLVGTKGKFVPAQMASSLLEVILRPGDRVCLEGNNQKQADFLVNALLSVNPEIINNLHLLQSTICLQEHLDLFRKGIASHIDFAFSGPQAKELATMLLKDEISIGAIHTYLELFGRYFTDLTPKVSLVAAELADPDGNLYTGPHTEETPTIVEATAFKQGLVVVQVAKVCKALPRVDIPGDWVDFVIETGQPPLSIPLFTRDPSSITDKQILMGMMVIKGIYAHYGVQSLNHGIGSATAAIELLLPTYGYALGLKGKVCTHWILNPHPTIIPAIETGWVKSIHSFGSEPGMEEYVRARSDVFFTGHDGSLRSNRLISQVAGLYAVDAFTGATLQIDEFGNSSTTTRDRIAGFGGAPNLGSNPKGRRYTSPSFRKAGEEDPLSSKQIGGLPRGRKLVIQITPTRSEKRDISVFRKELDAVALWREDYFSQPPIMVYGDEITHIVTEVGIAHVHRCSCLDERKAAIRAIAGETELGAEEKFDETCELRRRGIVQFPSDIGIQEGTVDRSLLSARSFEDLVQWSGGYYKPPRLTKRKK
ncbi:MAG: malonate decarboxylase subunit alpha [Candidatus Tritonobacter lacicola]|nr:malonate decarboxylase subunit alpha [Candidatus Tritonobacter lacicola]